MKKLLVLMIVSALCLCAFSACGSDDADVTGSWYAKEYNDAEIIEDILRSMELYDEEIALINTSSYYDLLTVEFSDNGNYRFYYDATKNLEVANKYVDAMFDSLYAGRSALGGFYGVDFSGYSLEEFRTFYAVDIYAQGSYAQLKNMIATDLSYAEVVEEGTYRVSGSKIFFKIKGESQEEYFSFTLKGDKLTMKGEDGTVECTKNP